MVPASKRSRHTVLGFIIVAAILFAGLGGLFAWRQNSTQGAVDTPSTGRSGGVSPRTKTPTTESSDLIPWAEATATVTRQDRTRLTVKASTVGLACTVGKLILHNGYETSLAHVRDIQFVAIHRKTGAADGIVTLVDGRELTDAIHTANCPLVGAGALGEVEIPLEEVRRIDFHR